MKSLTRIILTLMTSATLAVGGMNCQGYHTVPNEGELSCSSAKEQLKYHTAESQSLLGKLIGHYGSRKGYQSFVDDYCP